MSSQSKQKKRGIVLLEGKKAVKPFLHHKEKKKRRRMQKQTKKKAAAGVDTDIFIQVQIRQDKTGVYQTQRSKCPRRTHLRICKKKKNNSSRTTCGPSSKKCICRYSEKKKKEEQRKKKKRAIASNVKNTKEKKRVSCRRIAYKKKKEKGEREEQEVYLRILQEKTKTNIYKIFFKKRLFFSLQKKKKRGGAVAHAFSAADLQEGRNKEATRGDAQQDEALHQLVALILVALPHLDRVIHAQLCSVGEDDRDERGNEQPESDKAQHHQRTAKVELHLGVDMYGGYDGGNGAHATAGDVQRRTRNRRRAKPATAFVAGIDAVVVMRLVHVVLRLRVPEINLVFHLAAHGISARLTHEREERRAHAARREEHHKNAQNHTSIDHSLFVCFLKIPVYRHQNIVYGKLSFLFKMYMQLAAFFFFPPSFRSYLSREDEKGGKGRKERQV